MAAKVESMMWAGREKPWHGLGTQVIEAPSSKQALTLSGLDWKVKQKAIYTADGIIIPGYRANVRERDGSVLGVVSDKYKVVQNEEAFEFTDKLLGEGVRYETAGALQDGRKVWMLARLPREFIISGDQISPFLVFSNSHDGSGAIKVAMTPVRIVCNNTLNLALRTAKRCWSSKHTTNIMQRMDEAHQTLFMAEKYMAELGKEIENLQKVKLSDAKVISMMEYLIPSDESMSSVQQKNVERQRDDMKTRYFDAPDLKQVGNNAYRFLNAVSDYSTHTKPLRETANYKENLFARTMEGNSMLDKAYLMAKAA